MTRLTLLAALALAAGSITLLALHPWFQRHPLAERLRPYGPNGRPDTMAPVRGVRFGSVLATLAEVPRSIGRRVATATSSRDGLAERLERIGANETATDVRTRQVVWATIALLAGSALAAAMAAPVAVSTVIALAPVGIAVLSVEQRVRARSEEWQRRLNDELPVVAEQLGMLLGSGYSLGSAMQRVAERGHGVAASGLDEVVARTRHGVSDIDALREWAQRAQIPALDRLVSVLALNWEATDLGTLISAEARSMRREAQRGRVELIERRGQQVWIPVTVATLLPGVIFMAVPFIDAMDRIVGT